jgi:AraC-like DNA-binding protein
VELRAWPSDTELAPYVRLFWAASGVGTGAVEHIPPDGCMEILFHFGDPVEELRDDGVRIQPRAVLIGENKRASCVTPRGRVDVIGARITPAGIRAFIDAPAGELVDRTFALEDLVDPETRADLASVASAPPRTRIRLLERALLRKVRRARRFDPGAARVALRIEALGGNVAVETLGGALSVTRRQLERRFLDAVGMTPKTFAQVVRFQRVLAALGGARPRWADVAAACGYHDQAHLIRDFRRFTGTTPSAFLGETHPFVDLFVPSADVASVQSCEARPA